jgi:hypothetical protein
MTSFKQKKWEKIGTVAKPRFQNMYGLKGKQDVIWLDNWTSGNWSVVKGKEIKPSTYQEDETIGNFGSKEEAKKIQKEAMK